MYMTDCCVMLFVENNTPVQPRDQSSDKRLPYLRDHNKVPLNVRRTKLFNLPELLLPYGCNMVQPFQSLLLPGATTLCEHSFVMYELDQPSLHPFARWVESSWPATVTQSKHNFDCGRDFLRLHSRKLT